MVNEPCSRYTLMSICQFESSTKENVWRRQMLIMALELTAKSNFIDNCHFVIVPLVLTLNFIN